MDKRIGAQLYTLREFCKTAEDLDSTFAKLKEIGYKVVQVSGIGPIPAKEVKELADKYGLEIACTHRGYQEYKENLDTVIQYHHELGCKIAGLGAMPIECVQSMDSLKEFINSFNTISEELKKNGLIFGYHNHAFEFQKLDGKYVMDYLIENTGDNFHFIVDTYWLAIAGLNPAQHIKTLGKRAVALHFKDLQVIGNGAIMAEVMEGNLDWDSIIKAGEEAGSLWALVEQDTCQRNPFESMEISYKNLTTKGFC